MDERSKGMRSRLIEKKKENQEISKESNKIANQTCF